MNSKTGKRILAFLMSVLMALTVVLQGDFVFYKAGKVEAASIVDIEKECALDIIGSKYTFTGSEIYPTVKLRGAEDITATAISADCYTLSYENNIYVGTGKVIATGIPEKGYTGSCEAEFSIGKVSLSKAKWYINGVEYSSSSKPNIPYTKSVVHPTVTAVYNDVYNLQKSYDFSMGEYNNNMGVKSYVGADRDNCPYVKVSALDGGNFSSSKTMYFNIVAADIASQDITLSKYTYTYTGSACTPTVTVKDSTTNVALVSGTDYTLTYESNTNAGTAYAVIKGINNYTGEKKIPFTITGSGSSKTDISKYDSIKVASCYYTGLPQKPACTLAVGGKTLVPGTDYTVTYSNNVEPGTGKLTINACGSSYEGRIENYQFTIDKCPIANVDCSIDDYTYNWGNPITPAVSMTNNFGSTSKTLSINKDFRIKSIANNTQAGTASLVIEGIGTYYTGTATKTFKINPINAQSASVSASDCEYDGQAKTPAVTVTLSGKTISADSYSLVYKNNTNPGTATVIVTFKGNFTGTAQCGFKITSSMIDIEDCTATYTKTFTYSGERYTPAISLEYNGTALVEGTDYTVSYGENVRSGKGTITVTGTNKTYTGQKVCEFTIYSKQMDSLTYVGIERRNQTYEYTGETIMPDVQVKFGDYTLVEGTDYTVRRTSAKEIGETGSLYFTGAGNYTGVCYITFTIVSGKTDLRSAAVSGISAMTYTGSQLKPDVTVTYNGTTLTKNTDYTVSYGQNINAGTDAGTVTITGKGTYYGTITKKFTINRASISGSTVTLDSSSCTYDRAAHTPKVTSVVLGKKTLTAGTDYTVSTVTATNAGSYTVTVTGAGNYTGTAKAGYTISKKNISELSIADIPDQPYTGLPVTPAVTVKHGTYTLVQGTDYTMGYGSNTDAGRATAYVYGTGNYTGSNSRLFTICGTSIKNAVVTLDSSKVTYDRKSHTPVVKSVTLGGVTLKEGTDYKVTGVTATDAGTYTVTVSGIRNYMDQATASFVIEPRNISEVSIANLQPVTYTGSEIKPAISATYLGAALVAGTDYDVAYSNNKNAGTASAVIKCKGNFTGTKNLNFTINKQNISAAAVTLAETSVTYDRTAHTPAVKSVTLGGVTLKAGTDYTVSGTSAVTNAGSYNVVITGAGNYTGTKNAVYTIAKRNISDLTITGINNVEYTGSPIVPEPVVKFGDYTLVKGTEYTVSYSNNTNAGTATVYINASGNYTGNKSVQFTINKKSIASAVVTGVHDVAYTGRDIVFDGIKVTLNGIVLKENTDYTITYAGNRNITTASSKASVTITAMGNYSGSVVKYFEIKNMSSNDISAYIEGEPAETAVYTGSQICPVPVMDSTLVKDKDYTLTYSRNTNIGKASVTVTGINSYSGSKTYYFVIVPADITASFDTATVDSITVSWTAQNGAGGYRLYISDVSGEELAQTATVGGETTTYTFTGLETGKDYKVGVAAFADVDGRTYAGEPVAADYGTAPAKLTGLTSTANTNSTITLSWDEVENATGYLFYRYDTTTKKYVQRKTLVSGSTTTHTDINMKPGTTYKFAVRAYRTIGGKRVLGEYTSYTTTTRPANVTGLKVSLRGASSLKLTWNKSAGATGYVVYTYDRAKKAYVRTADIKNANTTYYISKKLTAGTICYYKVYAYRNYYGTYVYSGATQVKDITNPATPAVSVSSASKQFTVKWTGVTSASGYEVYVSSTANGTYRTLAKGNSSSRSYTCKNLTTGRKYYIKVRAYVNYNGTKIYSAYSAAKAVTVK